jgi:hypothetical protein
MRLRMRPYQITHHLWSSNKHQHVNLTALSINRGVVILPFPLFKLTTPFGNDFWNASIVSRWSNPPMVGTFMFWMSILAEIQRSEDWGSY